MDGDGLSESAREQRVRIVATADTHLYQDDIGVLPDGDVLVHAGDMLRFGDFDEFTIFVEWFLAQPHETKIVVAGNHDWCLHHDRDRAEAMLGAGVHYLQDSALEFAGLNWWGSPWQPAYRDWAFNLPRGSALRERWALIPAHTDILITHTPPAGIGDRSPMGEREGCEEFAQRLAQVRPSLHLFGHIHQNGGLWTGGVTTSANVTTWEGDRAATVLDLNLDSRMIVPVQVPPAGS